jgi:DNA topoisomerase-1
LGGKIQVLTGRYGPYVKHGKVNATIPKDREPEQVTMDEAVALIEARAAKGPAKKKAAKKPARKTKTSKTAKGNKEAVEETAG